MLFGLGLAISSTHQYCCLVIPSFNAKTGNLPKGEFSATWEEIVERFGGTPRRRRLLNGLLVALESLRRAGCKKVYLDGSFVTAKVEPEDFDACWEADGVDGDLLDEALLTFDAGRATQKTKFGGEFFVADWPADENGTLFRNFFQLDRDGNIKGIIVINLQELP